MGRTLVQIVAVFLAALFLLAGCGDVRVGYYYSNDVRMWDNVFDVEGYEFGGAPLGVILPHHMVPVFELARFYKGLSGVVDPATVFVVGPNHYEDGEANVQTCRRCVFGTIDGDVLVDDGMVERLVDDGVAEFNDEAFVREHSIYTHAPFVREFFPGARVVPVILKWETSLEEAGVLADWLHANLPEDALVIASVDFSHYMPVEVADFHDQVSHRAINNFEFDNIYDLEIDSPASISTLLGLMEKRGYLNAERFAHTNLQHFLSERVEETTSHQFFAFFEGAIERMEGIGVLSLGNLYGDSGYTVLEGWRWDPSGVGGVLADIAGAEDRFLVGADYLVFDQSYGDFIDDPEIVDEESIVGVYATPETYYVYNFSESPEKDVVKIPR